jgi:hypothetical protein
MRKTTRKRAAYDQVRGHRCNVGMRTAKMPAAPLLHRLTSPHLILLATRSPSFLLISPVKHSAEQFLQP